MRLVRGNEIKRGMATLAIQTDERVKTVRFTDDAINVGLMAGRIITVPLVWYPRSLHAKPAQRENWEICGGGYGLHWETLGEDLSTAGMLWADPAPGAVREVK